MTMPDSETMITVLMPVYNGEKYIKSAIESVINQTFKNFELIFHQLMALYIQLF